MKRMPWWLTVIALLPVALTLALILAIWSAPYIDEIGAVAAICCGICGCCFGIYGIGCWATERKRSDKSVLSALNRENRK